MTTIRYLACVAICSAVLSACGGAEETAPPAELSAPVVEVQAAKMRAVQPTITLPAVVEAMESSRLRPQVSAAVIERHVTPGALVDEGELLYQLDETDFKLALERAEATLATARATFREANAGWERAQRLQPQGAISQQGFEAALAAKSVAQSRVADAEARVEQAKVDLSLTQVRAPFHGRVSVAFHAVGDFVTPSSVEPLCDIVRLDPVYVTAQIDQKLYFEVSLREGQRRQEGEERIEDLVTTTIRLPTGESYPHVGHFVNWDNTGVAETGTVGARAEFPNPDGLLLPGNNVLLETTIDEPVERIVVPQRAVSQDQQGHFAMIVNDQNKVERRNLEVGIRVGPDWAIQSGLESGDRVIVHGLQLVRPGVEVETRPFTETG